MHEESMSPMLTSIVDLLLEFWFIIILVQYFDLHHCDAGVHTIRVILHRVQDSTCMFQ